MKVPVQILAGGVKELGASSSLGHVARTSIKEVASVSMRPDLQLQERELSSETSPLRANEASEDMINPLEVETLGQIKELLKEKHPSLERLMDISLKQEREKHERQNEKVLQILKIKDDLIGELQRKVAESESMLHDASERVKVKIMEDMYEEGSSKNSREELQTLDEKLLRLEAENYSERSMNDILRQQVNELQRRVQELNAQLSKQQEERKHDSIEYVNKNTIMQSLELARSSQEERLKELELNLKKTIQEKQSLMDENNMLKENYKDSIMQLCKAAKLSYRMDTNTTKDLHNQARECIHSLQRQLNNLQLESEGLKSKLECAEEALISSQAEKNDIVTRCNEEMSELRRMVIELENGAENSPNEVELEREIDRLKEEIRHYEQQSSERERYIVQVESDLKVQAHENSMLRRNSETSASVQRLKLQIRTLENQISELHRKENQSIPESVHEVVGNLEFALLQLREEFAELKSENVSVKQSLSSEIANREARIRALERVLDSSKKEATGYADANLEEMNRLLNSKVREMQESWSSLQKENARLKEIEALSKVLPSDKELIEKLLAKSKQQKEVVKHLQSLLIRAKLEFDTMHKRQLNCEVGKEVEESNVRFNSAYKKIIELRKEFIAKLMKEEEMHREHLARLFSENRSEVHEKTALAQRLNEKEEELKVERLHTKEMIDNENNMRIALEMKVKELEEELRKQRVAYKEQCGINKKNEAATEQKVAEISDLNKIIDTLKSPPKSDITQQYLNASEELYVIKGMNAKLENQISDLECASRKRREDHDALLNANTRLSQENKRLITGLEKNKGILKLSEEETIKLQNELDATRANLNNKVIKNSTLLSQLKIKRAQAAVLKLQLCECKSEPSASKSVGAEWKSGKLLVALVELVSEFSNAAEYRTIVRRLNDLIHKAKQEAVDEQNQSMKLLELSNEDRQAMEQIYTRCLKLEEENTSLGLLLESLLASNEAILTEGSHKTQRELRESRQALYQANRALVELKAENNHLKGEARESQDLLETRSQELCLARAGLEKELALAKISAEEAVMARLNARDEEAKSYFENCARRLLESGESQAVALGREVCAQKLVIEKLTRKVAEANRVKSTLENNVAELALALQRQNEELIELHAADYVKYKKKEEMYNEILKDENSLSKSMDWSKRALKYKDSIRAMQVADLHSAVEGLKLENVGLKLQIENQRVCEAHYGTRKEIIEELTRKNAKTKGMVEDKELEIKKLKKEIAEMASKHLAEMRHVQEKNEFIREGERKRALHEFDLRAKEFGSQDIPSHHFIALRQTIEGLNTDLISLKQRVKETERVADNYKSEAESHKKALKDTHSILNLEESSGTPLKGKSKRSSSVSGHVRKSTPSKLNEAVEQDELQLPKLVKELLNAKCNEAALESKTEELMRERAEMQKQIKEGHAEMRELKYKLRNYSTLLSDNNIKTDTQFTESAHVKELEARVVELEAAIETHRIRELKSLANSSHEKLMGESIPKELDEDTSNLLINGVITLCNRLAGTENAGNSNELEKLQRIVIKSLTELLKSLQKGSTNNLQALIPCDQTNKQVWYLELLDLEVERVEQVLARLNEVGATDNLAKVSVHIEGEVKRLNAAIELIKKDMPVNLGQHKMPMGMGGSEFSSQLARTEEVQNKMKVLMEENRRLETSLRKSKRDAEQNINELLIHEKLFNELKEQSRAMAGENKELKDKCLFLLDKIDFLEKMMQQRDSNANNQDLHNESSKNQIKAMEAELERNAIEILKLSTELKELKDKPQATKSRSNDYEHNTKFSEMVSASMIDARDDEREKMAVVIKQLDHELRERSEAFYTLQDKYEGDVRAQAEVIKMRELELQTLTGKNRSLEAHMDQLIEELNRARYELSHVNANLDERDRTRKVIEGTEVDKLRQDQIEREEMHKKHIQELQDEYSNAREVSRDLIGMYELQLKFLKERFKVEYVELNNKLTVRRQTKAPMSPNKRKEHELSVELMYQLSQKDAQIKLLQINLSKAKASLEEKKKQAQNKDEVRIKGKSNLPEERRRKGANESMENNSLILNSGIQLKAYNDAMQRKANLEVKCEKLQNSLKIAQCQLELEKGKTDDALVKVEKAKSEMESLRESLRLSKKEHNELVRSHRSEHQQVLSELGRVKSSWKSPEEFKQCQEERRELEAQVKELREDLSRKRELIRQWREKAELKHNEVQEIANEIESSKENNHAVMKQQIDRNNSKLRKVMRESERKDQMIRSLRSGIEAAKDSERQAAEENKLLVEKLKTLKAEVGRKETSLRLFKEKSLEARSELELSKDNEEAIEKFRTKLSIAKQEGARKDEQIRTLAAKLHTLMAAENTLRANELQTGNTHKDLYELEHKLYLAEGKTQNLAMLVRTIFRELLTDVEKLRMRIGAYRVAGLEGEWKVEGEDLGEVMKRVAKVVESKEEDEFEKLIECYRRLVKEKNELEKIFSQFENASEGKVLEAKMLA